MRKLVVRFIAAVFAIAIFSTGVASTAQAAPNKLCWLTGNLDCH